MTVLSKVKVTWNVCQGHDCRTDVAQRISDPSLWEKSVLAHGVRRSAAATAALHKVDSSGRPVKNKLVN
jgi:hypothetical protein